MSKDNFTIHDTSFSYRSDNNCRYMLHRLLNLLRKEGFNIENDKNVSKIIRKDYFKGKKEDLEIKAEVHNNGFKIMFFQNVVFENPNGGEYDFDKLQKMPYLIRLQYLKYIKKITDYVKTINNATDKTPPRYKLAEDQVKSHYVDDWYHEQADMNFNLSDLDGKEQPGYNGRDRDKKILRNGDIKYFRHWNGYLYRGRIYHNINNMWWVIINKYEYHNIANFELFDLSDEDFRHRLKKENIPKGYQEKRKVISDTSTKELLNELRRRGIRVNLAK